MKFISIQLRFKMWQAVRRWQPTTLTTLTTLTTWTTLTSLTSQSIFTIQVEFSNPDLQIEMFMTLGRSSALRNAMSPKKRVQNAVCLHQTESDPLGARSQTYLSGSQLLVTGRHTHIHHIHAGHRPRVQGRYAGHTDSYLHYQRVLYGSAPRFDISGYNGKLTQCVL